MTADAKSQAASAGVTAGAVGFQMHRGHVVRRVRVVAVLPFDQLLVKPVWGPLRRRTAYRLDQSAFTPAVIGQPVNR